MFPPSPSQTPVVAAFFGKAATPHHHQAKEDHDGSDDGSVRSTPSSNERLTVMKASLTKCFDTTARQHEQLVAQAATLDRLFKAQAEELQTSTYVVADSVLSKLGRTVAGKMSRIDTKPLPKSGRRRILRKHGGTFTTFPLDLDMLASTKALKLLPQCRLKFCLNSFWMFDSAAEGAMDLAIDCHTLMRLSVSRRIESVLWVSHLLVHQDPTKRPKEDFISPKTLALIEDAAKMREDFTWAIEARKVATGRRVLSFWGPLSQDPWRRAAIPYRPRARSRSGHRMPRKRRQRQGQTKAQEGTMGRRRGRHCHRRGRIPTHGPGVPL
jgi:hypothetical protein